MEPLREIRNRLLNGWQLSKMHTFEVAARHQSFALAAEELSLSPSAVSHRINQLEEELGIQLFVRSHRKVELTHEGKRVYWALKSSLDTLNQEILDIKNQELSGTLTLYSRPSIAQCWLVPALGDFTRRYPSISLTVLTGNDNVNLQRAGIDLAIYFDDAPSAQLAHHHHAYVLLVSQKVLAGDFSHILFRCMSCKRGSAQHNNGQCGQQILLHHFLRLP